MKITGCPVLTVLGRAALDHPVVQPLGISAGAAVRLDEVVDELRVRRRPAALQFCDEPLGRGAEERGRVGLRRPELVDLAEDGGGLHVADGRETAHVEGGLQTVGPPEQDNEMNSL